MSELAVPPEPLLDPVGGVLIDRDDVAGIADALIRIREAQQRLAFAKTTLESVVCEHSRERGTKTMRFPGVHITVSPDHKTDYDIEKLSALHDAGLPEDRWDALVVPEVCYKVNHSVVRQLKAANPVYAEIIDAAEVLTPTRQYVKISNG